MPTPDFLDPHKHPWLKSRPLTRIMGAIAEGGGEARVVGGAVRDALLIKVPHEIDFAVNLAPQRVAEILGAAGIKVIPTGIAYGTVTAVVDHKGYEITTLRHDVETDGRRTKVAFIDDWQADAARRDFTMNALYADGAGKLYDYFEGYSDLAAGRVRFIGDAEARITEDVLRILRFFRFTAWFGKGTPDAAALAACTKLKGLIPQLSVERVWREIVKLLAAENPVPAWTLMKDAGILAEILPEAVNTGRLESLLKIETTYEMPPSPLVRLAALVFCHDHAVTAASASIATATAAVPQEKVVAEKIAAKLKLSNRETEKIVTLSTLPGLLPGRLDPVPFRRALYEHGADACRDAVLLAGADNPAIDLEAVLELALSWQRPIFPLTGADLLKLGAKPGPEMGEVLRAVEAWWLEKDFRPTRDECLGEAKRRGNKS